MKYKVALHRTDEGISVSVPALPFNLRTVSDLPARSPKFAFGYALPIFLSAVWVHAQRAHKCAF